tara:strand:+ start:255 stop:887 length:633 start_codon:yes stop_codon:yes gene_type:complete
MDYGLEFFKWFLSVLTALIMLFLGQKIAISTEKKKEKEKQNRGVTDLYEDMELLNEKLKTRLKFYCKSYIDLFSWEEIKVTGLNDLNHVPWNISRDVGWGSLTKEQKYALTLLKEYLDTVFKEYSHYIDKFEQSERGSSYLGEMQARNRTIINFLAASYVLTLKFYKHEERLISRDYLPTNDEPKGVLKKALLAADVDITEPTIEKLLND